MRPRVVLDTQIRLLHDLDDRLDGHPQKKAFTTVANVFFTFDRAFQQQNPEPICQMETIFGLITWNGMKAEALRVAQSVDPTLTMDIFPEDICRSFAPFCRILMSEGSDEELVQRLSTLTIDKLKQEDAPEWVQAQMHNITQSETSVPEKTEATERLLHKVLRTPCANCDDLKEKMPRCGGCMAVRYCSIECQKAHWLEHKKVCRK